MCLALTTAASNGHFLVASYLLSHIPLNILEALSQQILKVARGQGSKSLDGVAFLKDRWSKSAFVEGVSARVL
jgi:hypothetical protein